MSNRSHSASNRPSVHHTRILKIGDQRLAREIGRMSPKIQKIAPQRFRNVSLTRGNVAPIFFEPDIAFGDRTGWLRMQSTTNPSLLPFPC